MLIRFSIFMLFTFSAFGAELSLAPLLRLLSADTLDQKELRVGCAESTNPNEIKSYHGNCIRSICGAPDAFGSIQDHLLGSRLLNKSLKDETNKSLIQDKINQYFSVRKKEFKKKKNDTNLNKLILDEIQNLQKGIDGDNLGVFLVGALLRTNEKLFEDILNEKAIIDKETLHLSFTPQVYESFAGNEPMLAFIREYEQWLNETGKIVHRAFDPTEFIETTYPNETLDQGIKLYLRKVKKIQKQLAKASPLYGAAQFNANLYLSKLKNKTLTEIDLKIMLNSGASIENRAQILKLIDGTYPEMVKDKIILIKESLSKVNSIESRNSLVLNTSSAISSLLDFHKQDLDSKHTEALESCMNAYDYNHKFLPSDKKIKKLIDTAAIAKKAYLASIANFSGLSKVSRPILISMLDQVRFSTPFSANTWSDVVDENISEFISNAKSNAKDLKLKSTVRGIIQSLLLSGRSDTTTSPLEYITAQTENPIANLCESFQQKAHSDSTLSATGIIHLSYTSALMPPEDAKAIIYHEMSHNLETMLTNGVSADTNFRFKENKSCINELHSYIGEANPSEKYFKEDFADYMSSRLLPKKSRSALCHLMDISEDGKSYKVDSFLADDDYDPHSSNAFRLLRFSVDNREELPEACIEAMAYEGIISVSRTCSF